MRLATRIKAMLRLVPLACCFLTLTTISSAQTLAAPLVGGVEHSEKLTPAFLPGHVVEVDKIEAVSGGDDWFAIPRWLGGSWQQKQSLRTYKYEENNGTADTSPTAISSSDRETFGWQKDKHGDYWSCRSLGKPISRTTEVISAASSKDAPINVDVITLRDNKFISSDKDHVSFNTRDSIVKIDKNKHTVVASESKENIRTLTCLGENVIAVYSDIQEYDDHGVPRERTKVASLYYKNSPFIERAQYEGRDLRSSFSKFLTRTGQMDLIPAK